MSIGNSARQHEAILSARGFYWRMVPDALWRHPDLEPLDIKVWCALLLYARDRGECNPTNAGLAAQDRALSGSLRSLGGSGAIRPLAADPGPMPPAEPSS
jgi:hypothetical protein